MQLSNALLVAIMFSTLVGLSLGGLLMNLSSIVVRDLPWSSGRRFLSWAGILLSLHLSLFWDTSSITRFEDWAFKGYLMIVLGPVLLLVTTQLLTAGLERPGPDGLDGLYALSARRFHWALFALSGWIVAASVVINATMVASSWRFALLAAISLACALRPVPALLGRASLAAWMVVLSALIT
jgi:hypothetical protein